jgi:hypothetical protein
VLYFVEVLIRRLRHFLCSGDGVFFGSTIAFIRHGSIKNVWRDRIDNLNHSTHDNG